MRAHGWDDAEGLLLDDRYEVGALLGRGGSAVVHRAWDRERRRAVAIKFLPPGSTAGSSKAEADILGALDHPHLVALHDVLTTDDGVALVMELVDGPSLAERLERGPLPADEAAVVLRDIAAGLAHAHRRGVVHRDVKPGNVLLRTDRGRVVEATLSDFGIARLADATRTTADRTVVGTVRFLSPEQARGERATTASDVYSLGLTTIMALTGEAAFPGSATESLAGRMLRAPALPGDLQEDWAELLGGMTGLDPGDRFDASAVAALACTLGSDTRSAAAAAASASTSVTRPIDLVPTASVVRPGRRVSRTALAVASMAAVGIVLGAAGALVFAPTAVQRALSGGAPDTVATAPPAPPPSAAPATRAPVPAAATPRDAVQQPAAVAETRSDDGRGRGSGGRHGSGGHGSDD